MRWQQCWQTCVQAAFMLALEMILHSESPRPTYSKYRPCRQSHLKSDRGGNGQPVMDQALNHSIQVPCIYCVRHPPRLFNPKHCTLSSTSYASLRALLVVHKPRPRMQISTSRRHETIGLDTTTGHERTARQHQKNTRQEMSHRQTRGHQPR